NLLVLAQPGRAVVRKDRARRDRQRRLHVGARPQEKAHALHPSLQQAAQTREVEVLRSLKTDCFYFNCYGPLVPVELAIKNGAVILLLVAVWVFLFACLDAWLDPPPW